jgi:hypothetical protein
MMWRRANKS